MTKPEPWSDINTTSQHLGIAEDTIRRWIKAKGFPAHRAGRVWRFKLSEVDEWVKSDGAKPQGSIP